MTDKENMSEFKMSKGYLTFTESAGTATQKLDAVLNHLNHNPDKAFYHGYELPNRYPKQKDVVLSDQDILNVLDRLERDKMVMMKMKTIGNGNPNLIEHYAINIDGELFLQDGGYSQKLIDDRNKKDKVEQDLKKSQRNEEIVKVASVFAAIGAIGIFLFEIYKFLC